MGINEVMRPMPPAKPILPDWATKPFVPIFGVITTVFTTLMTKTYDQFQNIGNLRKTVPEKIQLMTKPLKASYGEIMGAVKKLQGVPDADVGQVSTNLKSIFSSIITGYIDSSQKDFNVIVKQLTAKGFDGFFAGLGLVFPFNLVSNSLSVGEKISNSTFDVLHAFNRMLTGMTSTINKKIALLKSGRGGGPTRRTHFFELSKRKRTTRRVRRRRLL